MSARRTPRPPATPKPVSGGGGGFPRRNRGGARRAPSGARGGGHGGPVKPARPGRARPKRSAAGLLIHGDWITGYNDEAPTCMATAIANSLLSVTGLRVTDDQVLLLFRQSGGGQGVSMADSLLALATHGIAGLRPADYRIVPPAEQFCTGDIVGLAGTHAACFTGYGLISWGDVLPDGWEPDGEAWRIDWTV